MPIKRKHPVVIPAVSTPEKVYESTYFLGIEIDSSRLGQPVNAVISSVPFDGESSFLMNHVKRVVLADVFALATLDEDLAKVASALVMISGKMTDIAEELGVDRIDYDTLSKYIASQPKEESDESP
jgi:hypothetical protein